LLSCWPRCPKPTTTPTTTRRATLCASLLGVPVFVATAEDAILSKLEWAKIGDSERQLRDAARIIEVRGAGLDVAYLERWADVLGIRAMLERARKRSADE